MLRRDVSGRNQSIAETVLSLSIWKKSKSIFLYAALPTEVQTKQLISQGLKDKKKIALPRVENKKGEMRFYFIRTLNDLKQGKFGILEPIPSSRRLARRAPDLMIVPGLAFDPTGNRLGRGLGYYDRFLAKVKRAKKIGLAFREQMVKKIPTDKWDIKMDQIIAG